jgi:hypothetical protein
MLHFPSFHVLTQGTQSSHHLLPYADLTNRLKYRLLASITDRLNVAVKRVQEVLGSYLNPKIGYNDQSMS